MKKLLLLSIITIFLIGSGCANTDISNEKPIGGETDEHGCMVGAGYSWCEEKQECLRMWENWCADEINTAVKNFENDLDIIFEKENLEKMTWHTEEETLELVGKKYYLKDAQPDNYDILQNYFTENFEEDIYNMADGITGSLTGHIKNYTACTLGYTYTDGEVSEEGPFVPDTSKMDIEIQCGLFNQNWLENNTEELPTIATTCETSGGHWNECGNKCVLAAQGKDGVACTMQCEQLCECGGIAGFSCPAKHECITEAEGITDATGYCKVVFDEPTDGLVVDETMEVNNFEDCVAAGNPIMESYPQQCRHGDRTYTEEVEIPVDPVVELQM
jgi:hypothetical protein